MIASMSDKEYEPIDVNPLNAKNIIKIEVIMVESIYLYLMI